MELIYSAGSAVIYSLTPHLLLSLILCSFARVWSLYTLLKAKLTHFNAFQPEYIRTYNNNVIQDLPKLGSQQ